LYQNKQQYQISVFRALSTFLYIHDIHPLSWNNGPNFGATGNKANSFHGVEPFLRSRQLCRYSRTFQHFMEKRNAYRILVRKAEGKRPLGTPRHMWVDNIKMDL
jgi:hypothetical protein